MRKNKQIDIAESLQFFFKLPDWKERTIWIGGVSIASLVFYFLAFVLFFIPFIGWACGCVVFILLGLFFLLFWIYILGYQFEIIKAVAKGKKIDSVKINVYDSERLKCGFKIFIGSLVQNIPTIVLYGLGYGLILIPSVLLGFTSNSGVSDSDSLSPSLALVGIFGMFLGYIPFGIAWLYMMFQQFFFYPASICLYFKEEQISSMLKVREIWDLIKKNWISLLLYLAITFGIGMILYFVYMISIFLILLCIGIVLIPIVMAVAMSIIIHIQAHMLGQLCKLNK